VGGVIGNGRETGNGWIKREDSPRQADIITIFGYEVFLEENGYLCSGVIGGRGRAKEREGERGPIGGRRIGKKE